MMGYPYESDEARELNWQITEAIYYGAIQQSMKLAERMDHMKHFGITCK